MGAYQEQADGPWGIEATFADGSRRVMYARAKWRGHWILDEAYADAMKAGAVETRIVRTDRPDGRL